MDNNEFEWKTVLPWPSFFPFTVSRAFIWLPILIAAIAGSWFASKHQTLWNETEVFILFSIISTVTVSLFHWFGYYLLLKTSPRVIHSKISQQGLTIEKKTFPLAELQPALVVATQQVLPFEQWSQTSPIAGPFSLTLPATTGKIKLTFSGEEDKQKFIKSLIEYLKNSGL